MRKQKVFKTCHRYVLRTVPYIKCGRRCLSTRLCVYHDSRLTGPIDRTSVRTLLLLLFILFLFLFFQTSKYRTACTDKGIINLCENDKSNPSPSVYVKSYWVDARREQSSSLQYNNNNNINITKRRNRGPRTNAHGYNIIMVCCS